MFRRFVRWLSFRGAARRGVNSGFHEFAAEFSELPEKTLAGRVRCAPNVNIWFSRPTLHTTSAPGVIVVEGKAFIKFQNTERECVDFVVGDLTLETPTGARNNVLGREIVSNVYVYLTEGKTVRVTYGTQDAVVCVVSQAVFFP